MENPRIHKCGQLVRYPFVLVRVYKVDITGLETTILVARDKMGYFFVPIWEAAASTVEKLLKTGEQPFATFRLSREGVPYLKGISRDEASALWREYQERIRHQSADNSE